MPIGICDRCQQRYSFNADVDDYVHECKSGNPTLDNEDVVNTGDFEEFGASGTGAGKGEVMTQGAANRLQGTRAGIEGENFDGVTRRGERATTHRQRQHFEYANNISDLGEGAFWKDKSILEAKRVIKGLK